jgi:hypothetical protein
LGIQTTSQHNLTGDDRQLGVNGNGVGQGDYSDFNINNPLQAAGGFATTTGIDGRIKGVKVANDSNG